MAIQEHKPQGMVTDGEGGVAGKKREELKQIPWLGKGQLIVLFSENRHLAAI